MKKSQAKGVIILLLCSFIWGSSFIAQSEGMEVVEAFTFNGVRMLMAGLALLPVILSADAAARKKPDYDGAAKAQTSKKSVKTGLLIGLCLFAASTLQQFAFYYSTPGKIAFVTAFYMFLVPVFGLFFRKRPAPLIWLCVAVGFAGMYILCIGPNPIGEINLGDVLAFCCAVCYAWHIILVERLTPGADVLRVSATQFFVTGLISLPCMFIFETPKLSALASCVPALLYSGVLSGAVGYTLQIFGQKYTEPTVASLLMCLESVFGVVCAALFYREAPTAWETAGCAVMFAAIVLSQLADKISAAAAAAKSKRASARGTPD